LNARNFATSRLAREEKGATAVEYGIMVAFIAVGIIVAVGFLGDGLIDMFGDAKCALEGKTNTAASGATPVCGP
jgi:pilus assembly protein Flp/PilA